MNHSTKTMTWMVTTLAFLLACSGGVVVPNIRTIDGRFENSNGGVISSAKVKLYAIAEEGSFPAQAVDSLTTSDNGSFFFETESEEAFYVWIVDKDKSLVSLSKTKSGKSNVGLGSLQGTEPGSLVIRIPAGNETTLAVIKDTPFSVAIPDGADSVVIPLLPAGKYNIEFYDNEGVLLKDKGPGVVDIEGGEHREVSLSTPLTNPVDLPDSVTVQGKVSFEGLPLENALVRYWERPPHLPILRWKRDSTLTGSDGKFFFKAFSNYEIAISVKKDTGDFILAAAIKFRFPDADPTLLDDLAADTAAVFVMDLAARANHLVVAEFLDMPYFSSNTSPGTAHSPTFREIPPGSYKVYGIWENFSTAMDYFGADTLEYTVGPGDTITVPQLLPPPSE